MWSTCRTGFTEQIHHGAEVVYVGSGMIQVWAKLVSGLVSEHDAVDVVTETTPVLQQQPAAAVGKRPKNLVTRGNPGGDTIDASKERVTTASLNVRSGRINRVFNRGTKKTSDLKISHVVRLWRDLIQQQPLRMEPPDWTSKSGKSNHNKFDWATEISQRPSCNFSETLGKLGFHRCPTLRR